MNPSWAVVLVCIFLCKLWTPSETSILVKGSRLPRFKIITLWGSSHSNFTKMFPIDVYFYVKRWTHLGAPVLIQGLRFSQFWFYNSQGCIHSNIRNCCIVALEKKILKYVSYLLLCKTLNPSLGPSISSGVTAFTI